jgi:hypothetical protein
MSVLRAQDASPPAPQSPPAQEAPTGDETAQPANSERDGAGEKIDFPDAPDPGAPGTKPAAKPPAPSPSKDAPEGAAKDANAGCARRHLDGGRRAASRRRAAHARRRRLDAGTFEPTEKVRADFDVSFPVDI